MGDRRCAKRVFWWGNLRAGNHLENPSVDERKIFKTNLR
jgi:hypothetical protein